MGFRFRKSITLIPGVKVNLSKSGASLSVGGKGATVNVGRKGLRTSYDLPGSGAYYSTEKSWGQMGKDVDKLTGRESAPSTRPSSKRSAPAGSKSRSGTGKAKSHNGQDSARDTAMVMQPGEVRVSASARLDLNHFQRLSTRDDEEALLDGLKLVVAGDLQGALEVLPRAVGIADGAFVAGIAALGFGIYTDAARYFTAALSGRTELGVTLRKYGAMLWASLAVTPEVTAHIRADAPGALLALAECEQRLGNHQAALAALRELLTLTPGDMVARLSVAEILSEGKLAVEDTAREIAALGEGVENESEMHCALLLYQARALKQLGLNEAAKAALTRALSKRKDRSATMLAEIRVERGQVLEALGDKRSARSDYERAYADDPDFPSLAEMIGRV